MVTNENLPPVVIKQVAKELKSLNNSPPEGIRVVVNDDNFSTIHADIEGPAGTPYESRLFRMKLILTRDFPQSPPIGYFLTKIFVMFFSCLLIEPYPESALNEQAGKMLLENYEEYARHARLLTGIHAIKPKPKIKLTKALNSDQSSGVNLSQDQKNLAPALPLSLNVVPATTEAASGSVLEAGICGSTAVTGASQKKGSGLVKVHQTDKKKNDARKKSLKRL